MVSWRGNKMRLIALRGQVQANGAAVAEVTLRPRLELRLSRDTVVVVQEVVVPDTVLCLSGVAGGTLEVNAPLASVVGEQRRLVPGLHHDAHLTLWTESATWYARPRGAEASALASGQAWEIAGRSVLAAAVPTSQVGVATRAADSASVTVAIESGVVRLSAEGAPPLVLGGNQAELILRLAEADEPQHWTTIANYFWPERERDRWRERFDAMVKEVRNKFRDHRIRGDLLWSWDGSYRLNLQDGEELRRGDR